MADQQNDTDKEIAKAQQLKDYGHPGLTPDQYPEQAGLHGDPMTAPGAFPEQRDTGITEVTHSGPMPTGENQIDVSPPEEKFESDKKESLARSAVIRAQQAAQTPAQRDAGLDTNRDGSQREESGLSPAGLRAAAQRAVETPAVPAEQRLAANNAAMKAGFANGGSRGTIGRPMQQEVTRGGTLENVGGGAYQNPTQAGRAQPPRVSGPAMQLPMIAQTAPQQAQAQAQGAQGQSPAAAGQPPAGMTARSQTVKNAGGTTTYAVPAVTKERPETAWGAQEHVEARKETLAKLATAQPGSLEYEHLRDDLARHGAAAMTKSASQFEHDNIDKAPLSVAANYLKLVKTILANWEKSEGMRPQDHALAAQVYDVFYKKAAAISQEVIEKQNPALALERLAKTSDTVAMPGSKATGRWQQFQAHEPEMRKKFEDTPAGQKSFEAFKKVLLDQHNAEDATRFRTDFKTVFTGKGGTPKDEIELAAAEFKLGTEAVNDGHFKDAKQIYEASTVDSQTGAPLHALTPKQQFIAEQYGKIQALKNDIADSEQRITKEVKTNKEAYTELAPMFSAYEVGGGDRMQRMFAARAAAPKAAQAIERQSNEARKHLFAASAGITLWTDKQNAATNPVDKQKATDALMNATSQKIQWEKRQKQLLAESEILGGRFFSKESDSTPEPNQTNTKEPTEVAE